MSTKKNSTYGDNDDILAGMNGATQDLASFFNKKKKLIVHETPDLQVPAVPEDPVKSILINDELENNKLKTSRDNKKKIKSEDINFDNFIDIFLIHAGDDIESRKQIYISEIEYKYLSHLQDLSKRVNHNKGLSLKQLLSNIVKFHREHFKSIRNEIKNKYPINMEDF